MSGAEEDATVDRLIANGLSPSEARRVAMERTLERRQVTARLDGCDHPLVSPDGGSWWCETCGQRFGPIFTEEVRSYGVTIKEAMKRG